MDYGFLELEPLTYDVQKKGHAVCRSNSLLLLMKPKFSPGNEKPLLLVREKTPKLFLQETPIK